MCCLNAEKSETRLKGGLKRKILQKLPRSHVAVLTTLIISDICGLLSFPPSCFFFF